MVPDLEETAVMRVLVRHGFSRDLADALLDDLRRALAYFETHPVAHPMEVDSGRSYAH
jgi:glutamate decarboxylase